MSITPTSIFRLISKLIFALALFALLACGRMERGSEEGLFFRNAEAAWISDGKGLPGADSLFYLDCPAPLFRKEFTTGREIKDAWLYITAAGYYRATLNGEAIGKNVLDPAWTDFSKRIYYSEYDVKSLIADGLNCLGVSLGNGFYNPLPLQFWGGLNLRDEIPAGKPVFIAKLIIDYADGKSEEIVTDSSWSYAYGPIMKNSVYLGVSYDASKELHGWDNPGFNDAAWMSAVIEEGPGGELQKAFFPAVQITEEISPVRIYSPGADTCVVDMGVNFSGTYKMKLKGLSGDTIVFRFGERIYEDGRLNPMTSVAGQIKRNGMGGPGAPDIAWQTDSYVIGEGEEEWFSPGFTYHTFRYMEISGLGYTPRLSDIKGLFIHSNIDRENHFSCSSGLLNSIQDAVVRTFRANLVSVQSDCPARERFGYGGDLNATCESFISNFDMQAFYRKTIYDWVDAMDDSLFVDTAPYTGIAYCGLSWESAFLLTQYYLYLYYGDIDLVAELYELNKKWMDKAERIHPKGLVDAGLGDHESLEPVPVQLTGSCHYMQCAGIMKTFAALMGDLVYEQKYEALESRLRQELKAEFWDKPVSGEINRQTLFSALLYHGIVADEEIDAAKDSLLLALKNGPSGHFSTGIFGTKYILEALSEYDSPQEVFDVISSKEYPGWGFMIDQGATSIWETWKESDNTYSNCHPMFGTVTEWYYRWLGGIRPDPDNPGFEEFVLNPFIPEGLEYVNCSYTSPYGQIVSNWRKEGESLFHYEMTIPKGSSAKVMIAPDTLASLRIQSQDADFKPEDVPDLQSGEFRLREGKYRITVTSKISRE